MRHLAASLLHQLPPICTTSTVSFASIYAVTLRIQLMSPSCSPSENSAFCFTQWLHATQSVSYSPRPGPTQPAARSRPRGFFLFRIHRCSDESWRFPMSMIRSVPEPFTTQQPAMARQHWAAPLTNGLNIMHTDFVQLRLVSYKVIWMLASSPRSLFFSAQCVNAGLVLYVKNHSRTIRVLCFPRSGDMWTSCCCKDVKCGSLTGLPAIATLPYTGNANHFRKNDQHTLKLLSAGTGFSVRHVSLKGSH